MSSVWHMEFSNRPNTRSWWVFFPACIKEISTKEHHSSVSDSARLVKFQTIPPCPHFLPLNLIFGIVVSWDKRKQKIDIPGPIKQFLSVFSPLCLCIGHMLLQQTYNPFFWHVGSMYHKKSRKNSFLKMFIFYDLKKNKIKRSVFET